VKLATFVCNKLVHAYIGVTRVVIHVHVFFGDYITERELPHMFDVDTITVMIVMTPLGDEAYSSNTFVLECTKRLLLFAYFVMKLITELDRRTAACMQCQPTQACCCITWQYQSLLCYRACKT
jgi:hypothetical protein